MLRLAIAFVLALVVTAANAQDTKSGQAHTPTVGSADGTRPSYLMDECRVMASGGERSPTIITPTPAPLWCRQKQTSPRPNDESAHP
jgi:hypothetical protein